MFFATLLVIGATSVKPNTLSGCEPGKQASWMPKGSNARGPLSGREQTQSNEQMHVVIAMSAAVDAAGSSRTQIRLH